MQLRTGRPEEVAAVMSILDAAMLEVSAETVRSLAAQDGDDGVLLAVEEGRILGALVLDDSEIEAIAVRPNRRDQGIGSALVRAASERTEGALWAAFDGDLRPFYVGLGFEVEPASGDGADDAKAGGEDRLRARLSDESP